ncbi:hypothetical protein Poli38472_001758 [Pythium oligandrum]|uniref:MPN domain-containing protein n=1 Tax=Pythium oligandrum TaxID=41045 RepID=A0A8K1FS27_PYTOL|nr:hypothetical protein Poli38472_001758 [Pythium oligandrum]|eukprot:TMW69602.1 hypothetical protein Poli38472_001758 [Pythium oligandrum]
MTDYRLFPEAYVKLLLHVAKHPSSTCSGLLIGEAAGQTVEISDVVPLFHHESPLAPLTEVACTMVDTWCEQQKKKIVGYYHANGIGLEAQPSLSLSGEKIADQIESNNARSCVLLVENAQLNSESKTGLQLLLKDVKRGWVRVDNRLHLTEESSGEGSPVKLFSQALQQHVEDEIVDMDEHFEDVRKDWRNQHVLQLLKLNV